MEVKLFDSELKILELLWDAGELTAAELARQAKERVGWSKSTTYTVIKKCVDKGAVERVEPGFVCRPLVTREEAQRYETRELINRMYGGAADRLVASLLGSRTLSRQEIARLRALVDDLEVE